MPKKKSLTGNAELVIEHLKTLAQGSELKSAELAQAVGKCYDGFGQTLKCAVGPGLLYRRVSAGVCYWSLGINAGGEAEEQQAVEVARRTRRQKPAAGPSMPALDEDDDGVKHVSVSAYAVPSVFAFAASRNAAPFSAALASDGRLICERHGRVVLEFTASEAAIVRRVALHGVQPAGAQP